jgi:hypothetical protein
MRQAPLNYLVTIVLGALIWVVTGMVAGSRLAAAVVLQLLTTGQFLQRYQTVLGAAAVLGVLLCLYWYYYGSRADVAARLGDARRTWTLLFVGELVVAVGALVALVLLYRTESLTGGNFAEIFGLLVLQTVVLFWAGTFLMSPRSVEYIPWGKR